MKTAEFDYVLPQGLIAQVPQEPRDASRLLVLDRRTGLLEHRHFRDLGHYLRAGDVLVANDSRVLPARLYGRRGDTGGHVELLLMAERADGVWEVLVKPGRRVREGNWLEFDVPRSVGNGGATGPVAERPTDRGELRCEVLERTSFGGRLVRFTGCDDLAGALQLHGVVPLPPYIHCPLEDPERYQTVYSRISGSAAAPTAGLHFTAQLMEDLQTIGVDFAFVTLHIGLDTFRPVSVEDVENHEMHSEFATVGSDTAAKLNAARRQGGRIFAVGTTAVRVLESVAAEDGTFAAYTGWTNLFIRPGYQFKVVDGLITNFHLPRSTLLMLVSALATRESLFRAYREAVNHGYRFYSFGDAMLIL